MGVRETDRDRQIWETLQRCRIGGGGEARQFAKICGVIANDGTINADLFLKCKSSKASREVRSGMGEANRRVSLARRKTDPSLTVSGISSS